MALCVASCGNKESAPKGKSETTATAPKSSQSAKSNKKSKPAPKSKKKSLLMPNASGLPYEMLVVMPDDQWERPLGRAVYNVLDTDVPGLPQSERSFRISRVDPSVSIRFGH